VPYNEHSEYPGNVFSTVALTTTPQTVFTGKRKVSHMVITGGAALETIIFRGIDNTPEYWRLLVPISATITISRGWEVYAEESDGSGSGLEILTLDPAGDVGVAIFYV
jgi:hypothetical protein